jgi:hypothetical protein
LEGMGRGAVEAGPFADDAGARIFIIPVHE